jgi:NDP-4-keto-2,6-dideoxyhexose 3-C-methyltransferase
MASSSIEVYQPGFSSCSRYTSAMHIREIAGCRVCGNTHLVQILDLGVQALTGRFEPPEAPPPPSGPLVLVRCDASSEHPGCGLVQLAHDYHGEDMYGPGYGYRSSVTQTMVRHLEQKAAALAALARARPGDAVLDIGCNDGTLLRSYADLGVRRFGIDPSAGQFASDFPRDVRLIVDFFSAERVRREAPGVKFRIITSIAMFYDVARPLQFMRDIAELLADDGVWETEQAYLPSTLGKLCYDTVCHEHLTYYSLHQIAWLAERAGLELIDAGLNDVNGGSFRVVLARAGSALHANRDAVGALLAREKHGAFLERGPYERFTRQVARHRDIMREFFRSAQHDGKSVLGYGASTKGNVLLQYCAIGRAELPAVLDRYPKKQGLVTPGTRIPIISEEEGRARRPDYLLVLPWHFRDEMIRREKAFLDGGGRLVFPLPTFEIVGAGGKVLEARSHELPVQ